MRDGHRRARRTAQSGPVIPEDNRFESDPDEVLPDDPPLPPGWVVDTPTRPTASTSPGSTQLLRAHERHGRGWAGRRSTTSWSRSPSSGLRMRENVVLRDPDGDIRAWGSVHDRAVGRMLFVHSSSAISPTTSPTAAPTVLVRLGRGQAREVGAARGLDVQQIDTGAFADDERQHPGWRPPASSGSAPGGR